MAILGIHGSKLFKTPNLDKMAAEGYRFQNFSVVNFLVFSPSRVAVMTGQYPARQSVHGHFASVRSHIQRNYAGLVESPGLPFTSQNVKWSWIFPRGPFWFKMRICPIPLLKDAPSPLRVWITMSMAHFNLRATYIKCRPILLYIKIYWDFVESRNKISHL